MKFAEQDSPVNCSSDETSYIRTNSKKKLDKPSIYWTSDTENAIIEYNRSTDQAERNDIYMKRLKFAFEKMAENVFNTFRFSYFETSHEDAMKECVGFMMEKISKYEAEKGKGSSFGYFSIVAKNYFILVNNATYKKWKLHDNIEPTPEHPKEFIVDDHSKVKSKEKSEFIVLMVKYWEENVTKLFTKKRDLDIAYGIIHLFKNQDRIDLFNKKYLYLCIREISGCKTQQITKVINKMKHSQTAITKEYFKHGKITIRPDKVYTRSDTDTDDVEEIMFDSKTL
jgi:hypothetical protein